MEISYPSIIPDMAMEDYHARPEISKHGLDRMAISPLHYKTERDEAFVASEALQTGTLVHTSVLEPDLYPECYLLAPDCDNRSKEGKERWRIIEEQAKAEKKIVATAETLELVRNITEAINGHRSAKLALSSGGLIEPSLFAIDPETGVAMRGRPDLISKGNAIVDIKTCQSEKGGYAEFSRSCANFRYDVQAAYYLDLCRLVGLEKTAFVFIVAEKGAPFAVATYQLDDESVQAGRDQYRKNLALYAECLKNDEWPAYSQSVEMISLPKWKLRQVAGA